MYNAMPRHIERWENSNNMNGTISSMPAWENSINNILSYYSNRVEYSTLFFRQYFRTRWYGKYQFRYLSN